MPAFFIYIFSHTFSKNLQNFVPGQHFIASLHYKGTMILASASYLLAIALLYNFNFVFASHFTLITARLISLATD